MSSSRLPGKVLADLGGQPMLARMVERLRRAQTVDKIVVATSIDADDDVLASLADNLGTELFRGPLADVLGRYAMAAVACDADHIVRLTQDCPLVDPALVDALVSLHLESKADYTSNVDPPTFPDGLDVEVMTVEALLDAERASRQVREHITTLFRGLPKWKRSAIRCEFGDHSQVKWSVDTLDDLRRVRRIFAALYPSKPNFGWLDIMALEGLTNAD